MSMRSRKQSPTTTGTPDERSVPIAADGRSAQVAFEKLNPVEQSAASLGVDPEAWKPIKFMNEAHFDALLKNNALDDALARRIEAFRSISSKE